MALSLKLVTVQLRRVKLPRGQPCDKRNSRCCAKSYEPKGLPSSWYIKALRTKGPRNQGAYLLYYPFLVPTDLRLYAGGKGWDPDRNIKFNKDLYHSALSI